MLHSEGEGEYVYFNSPWTALVKTSTMFVGELEFSDVAGVIGRVYFWATFFGGILVATPHTFTMSQTITGISWTYTALIMVFWCHRKTVRLFLKVKISFSL